MTPDQTRFYDGGSPGDDGAVPDPSQPMQVRLRRVVEPVPRRFLFWSWTRQRELFAIEHRIAYQARGHDSPHIVPVDDDFRSDLTSVPSLFTWLVPRTGCHLPAALVHDGLVNDPGLRRSYVGPEVSRAEADRIFREAMGDLGTGAARRWLMWTAVTLATVKQGATSNPVANAYYRVVVFGSLLVVLALGVLATLDLFDIVAILPWMGERSLGAELLLGGAAAILVPLLLAVTWLRFAPGGAIAGVALALLLHVTILLGLLTVLFQVLELATRSRKATAVVEEQGPEGAHDGPIGPLLAGGGPA